MDHTSSVPPAGITLTLLTPILFNFKSPFCLCSDWGLKATAVIWPKDNTAKGAEYLGPLGTTSQPPRPGRAGNSGLGATLPSGRRRRAKEGFQHLTGEADSLEIARPGSSRNRPEAHASHPWPCPREGLKCPMPRTYEFLSSSRPWVPPKWQKGFQPTLDSCFQNSGSEIHSKLGTIFTSL